MLRFPGQALLALFFVTRLGAPSGAQTELPYFDGRPTALDNNPGSTGALGSQQSTTSDQFERGKNTFGFAVLDASVGWDGALADLIAANPGSPSALNLAPIAVIEGNFALTEPPLHIPVVAPAKRRILRGSGGLRLGLIHNGNPEVETLALNGWTEPQRTFLPHAGLLQMAESLAVDQPAKYGFLANILPASAREISVHSVKAIRVNNRPWLVVGCSVQTAAANYDPASGDDAYARNAQRNRLFAWDSPTAKWVDVSSTKLPSWSSAADWEQNTWGVGTGDLNNDGTTDLVFGNYGNDFAGATNQILLGNGSGTFEFRTLASPFVAGDVSTDIVVADLDVDGFRDIVVANRYLGWGTPTSAPEVVQNRSRDYVLFGRLAAQPIPGTTLTQPKFTAPVFLEPYAAGHSTDTIYANVRDTVALDVGDVDHDGDLDVLAANHGNPGLPFVMDNEYPCNDFVRRHLNEDAVYLCDRQSSPLPPPPPVFTTVWNLPGTGGDGQLTTDIVFHDIARPLDLRWNGGWIGSQPQNNWYAMRMAETVTGQDDGAWRLVDIRDGWLDITRVCRTRGGGPTRINHLINDPRYFETSPVGQHQSFAGFTDESSGSVWSETLPGGPVIPPVDYLYGGSFFLLHYGWSDPVFLAPIAGGFGSVNHPSNPVGSPPPSSFATLCYSNELIDFGQCLATADFVPDKAFVVGSYTPGGGWPSSPDLVNHKGYPDLLIGQGYELSGVPNRLYPFTSAQLIQRVDGNEMAGVRGWGRGGSWTSGWSEKTNKGYGVGLIDAENDGDLDAITTQRTGAFLYRNDGTPGIAGGKEGRFTRVTSTNLWPSNDVPYAHSVLFREDSCTGDFDNDGDQDAFLVGFAGRYDFSRGFARGERDEDASGNPWLHRPGNQLHNDSMLQGTQLLLNQTVVQGGASAPGAFSLRSDRLDYRGRYEADQGGDRAIAADFDADGKLDMLEPRWLITDQTSPGDPVLSGDWTSGPGGKPNYDVIARNRAVLFRYWHNVTPTGGTAQFADEAADIDGNPATLDPRVRCKTSAGVTHFGTLDALGGTDYNPGSASPLLHLRDYVGITASDLNNDGFVDVLAAYQNHGPAGPTNGYNLFLCDSTGVLWDSTHAAFLTPWLDANVAGTTGAGSFCLASNDYDLDGDVDVFVTFSQLHDMALLENGYNGSSSNLPAHPFGHALPRAKLTARPFGSFSGGTWVAGWMREPLHRMNFPWLGAGQHVPEGMFWSVPVDADYDGDQDLISFTGGSGAHSFWENHVIDAVQPGSYFSDRSCDAANTGAVACGGVPLDVAHLQGEMRITASPGVVTTDLEVADLNGDSVPDLFAGYSSRHDTPYFGEWEASSPVQPSVPYISKVFPETGQKAGKKIRIYGTNLSGVRRVDLLFGAQAAPVALIINQTGSITAGPAGRYLDVQLPAVAAANQKGPCGIRVYKSGVSSPVWRNTAFTLIP